MEYVIGLNYTQNPRVAASLGIMEKEKYIKVHGNIPENFKVIKGWPSDFVGKVNKILRGDNNATVDGLRLYHISKESLQGIIAEMEKLEA